MVDPVRAESSTPPTDADAPAAELAFARQHFFVPHRTRDPFGNTSTTRHDPYVLLVTETRDALATARRAEHDYRVLQPRPADRSQRQPRRGGLRHPGPGRRHSRDGQGDRDSWATRWPASQPT